MNESTASIARNTKAMLVSQVITWSSSFLLMLFLPRYLGPEEYGRLYFAISLNALTGLLIDLGLTMFFVKEIARDKGKIQLLIVNGLALRALAWTISFVGTIAFVVFAGYPRTTVYVVFVLALGNLFYGWYDLIHRVFHGMERLEYRSIALVIEKVFLSVLSVFLLLLGVGPLGVALVMMSSMLLNLLVSTYFLRKMVKVSIHIVPSTWPGLLKSGFPFLLSTSLAFIYYRVDVFMLSQMTSDTVLGWYGAAHRLFDTFMFFPLILTTAVYPVLARLWHTSKEDMFETSRRVFDLTLIVAMPLAVGMIGLAQPIIALLGGGLDKFWNSIILLQILAGSLLLVYVDFVLNTVLVSHDKQKELSIVALIATVINIATNFFAIRYFHEHYGNGAIGSAITTGITELCVMTMSIYLLPKGSLTKHNVALAGKAMFGGVVMLAVMWLVQSHILRSWGWIVAGVVGIGVYLTVLFALRVVSRREVNFVLRLLPLRKQVAASIPTE